MSKVVNIAPTSRIEGHGKVSLHFDDTGQLIDSKFHVVEFRGFEKFCQGRKFWEMPRITTRACGICPISHHLASAKACDNLLGVDIPQSAKLVRELLHMGQIVHSHALHFFFLAAPDFLFPKDEARRNVLGILEKNPDLAKQAIELRKMGQEVNHIVGGKAIHPVVALPGGVSKVPDSEEQQLIEGYFKRAIELTQAGLGVAKQIFEKNGEFIGSFAELETNHLGLVKDGNLEMYDGTLRLTDQKANIIKEFSSSEYVDYMGEHTETWSWLKFPFYKPYGWPEGTYRVGPLARLNVIDKIPTPLAQKELEEYRSKHGRSPGHTLLFHYTRLIECLYAAERGLEIAQDPELLNTDCRKKLSIQKGEGVGIIEAPRGTLVHHYVADETGTIEKANLIVSTVGNNPAMNRAVHAAAKDFVKAEDDLTEPVMNLIEMAVRAHDPCLSCATHAVGKMPLKVELFDKEGNKFGERIKE